MTIDQYVQEVPTSRRKTVQAKQIEGKDQSAPTRRDKSNNISLSQRSDSRTLRTSQDIRKDKTSVLLAKDVRRNKMVYRIISRLPDTRQTEKKQRTQSYSTNRTLKKSRDWFCKAIISDLTRELIYHYHSKLLYSIAQSSCGIPSFSSTSRQIYLRRNYLPTQHHRCNTFWPRNILCKWSDQTSCPKIWHEISQNNSVPSSD